LGKREPVRQLKKAGSVLILEQQILYTHAVCKDKNQNDSIAGEHDEAPCKKFVK